MPIWSFHTTCVSLINLRGELEGMNLPGQPVGFYFGPPQVHRGIFHQAIVYEWEIQREEEIQRNGLKPRRYLVVHWVRLPGEESFRLAWDAIPRECPPSETLAECDRAGIQAPEGLRRIAAASEGTGKRLKRGEAALKIRAALESLAREGKWNVAEAEIRARAGVSKSTYYSVLSKDEQVKNTMDDYHARRLGRGPVRADEI
jgi:hypothetical protein